MLLFRNESRTHTAVQWMVSTSCIPGAVQTGRPQALPT